MNCRVCGGGLVSILRLENMPSRAQHLPDMQRLGEDLPITLEIAQCELCDLVQLTNEPVSYWREVIRSDVSQEVRDFRSEQLAKIVRDWGLEKVIEIGSDHLASTIQYDGFLLLSSLEHVPNPNELLARVRKSLRFGAVGIVEVPNFDMILDKNMVSEFMLDHLFYFTEDTLRRTLEINGFDVLSVEPIFNDYVLSATVIKREPTDLSGMSFNGEKIKEFIDGKEIAIWGAGHQALATLCLLNLDSNRIKYVVDSSTVKQGRFTPVTHIPIVPPKALETDPVEAVIVMCGSYSDEVSKLVRNYNVPVMVV